MEALAWKEVGHGPSLSSLSCEARLSLGMLIVQLAVQEPPDTHTHMHADRGTLGSRS